MADKIQPLRIRTNIVNEQTVPVEEIYRVMDMLGDLECNVTTSIAGKYACNMLEHKYHMPPDSLHADNEMYEQYFDEVADENYAMGRKLIAKALVELNWYSELKPLMERLENER